jgi:hypothetical protein
MLIMQGSKRLWRWYIPAVANRWSADHWWSARKFWWSVEIFGHYLQFLCSLYCFIIFWFVFVSPTQDRWQFAPYYVASNFILIKCNFYDNYFIDVCTFLKKIHVSGPWDSKLWVLWSVRSEWLATAGIYRCELLVCWTLSIVFNANKT